MIGHGRGHNGRCGDDVGIHLLGLSDEFGSGDIHAQVMNLKSGRAEEGCYDILSNFMDIGLNGSDDHRPYLPDAFPRGQHPGLQQFHGLVPGLGRHQHLGKKYLPVTESIPHFLHGWHHSPSNDGEWLYSIERLLDQLSTSLHVPTDNSLFDSFQVVISGHVRYLLLNRFSKKTGVS